MRRTLYGRRRSRGTIERSSSSRRSCGSSVDATGGGAGGGGGDGQDGRFPHQEPPPGDERQVGDPHRPELLAAAAPAGAIHQADQGHPHVVRQAFGEDHLLPDGGVCGAAADGEVVALHGHAPARDAALADDHVRGKEVHELLVVVRRLPGDRASLVECPSVEEAIDALANRQPAAAMLALDPLVPAHPARELLAPAQLLELGLPGHRRRGYSRGHEGAPATRGVFTSEIERGPLRGPLSCIETSPTPPKHHAGAGYPPNRSLVPTSARSGQSLSRYLLSLRAP